MDAGVRKVSVDLYGGTSRKYDKVEKKENTAQYLSCKKEGTIRRHI